MKLINPLEDASAYLYHYTSTETALEYILKTGTLLFNSFSRVNDPRESKYWDISTLIRADINFEPEQYDALSSEISQILKSSAKLVCFSQDKPESQNAWQPRALLQRGFAKPSMWHHYANGHNGVCLMFSREKLLKSINKQLHSKQLFHGQVAYTNEGILPKLQNDQFSIDLRSVHNEESYFQAIQSHFDFWYRDLFLTKLSDWSHEDEYRYIYLDEDDQPTLVDFEESLEAIVIGEGAIEKHRDDFLKHCITYKADIANLIWRNGFPKVEHLAQPHITHRNLF